MADTTILIENPDVVRDIQKLAAQTGKPVADAVADAVRAKLGEQGTRSAESKADKDVELAAILARIDALPRLSDPLTDDDLYDEDGMPR